MKFIFIYFEKNYYLCTMKKIKNICIALTLSILPSINLLAQDSDFRNGALSIDQRVEILMQKLTLDEKISLMEHQNPAIERLGLKPYSWWSEALHGVARNGVATVYPMPIGMAATWDTALVRNVYSAVAKEGRRKFNEARAVGQYGDNKGVTFFSPNINILRDPRWGRGMETFGEDPFLTSRIGLATVKGLQTPRGKGLMATACLKHFAAHSGPEYNRHSFDATVSRRDLWTTYLPAFEYIIKNSNVQQVMTAYNRLNGIPCSTNATLLIEILRKRWNFDGMVVTDCWALNDCWECDSVTPRHETHSTAESATADAFGSEVDMECGSGLQALKEAVANGSVSEADINRHVRRILRTRLLAGIDDAVPTQVTKPANLSLQAARESIVMLQNNGSLPLPLPLKSNPARSSVPGKAPIHKIAILGPTSNDTNVLLGNYNGTPERKVTVLQAFQNYAKSIVPRRKGQNTLSIFHHDVCPLVDTSIYFMPDNFAFWDSIDACDAIIFVGGLSPMLEGEELNVEQPGFYHGDRTAIELPEVQQHALKVIRKHTTKPVILVLTNGSAVALGNVVDRVNAILVGWYGGESMGEALVNVIGNLTNEPMFGRLPVTFYESTEQLPPYEDYSMTGRTYRYLEEAPLFRFGYGLTYNKSHIKYAHHYADNYTQSHLISGELEVQGNPANEVVQVYLKCLDDPEGPTKSLVGFYRLPKGRVDYNREQSIRFSIPIREEAFYVYDEPSQSLVEPLPGTRFILQVGMSSDDRQSINILVTYKGRPSPQE